MSKVSSLPRPVNPTLSVSLPLHIRRQINGRAICPWCGSQMYLDRAGDRLLCTDSVHCAGVMSATQALAEIHEQQATRKEVA